MPIYLMPLAQHGGVVMVLPRFICPTSEVGLQEVWMVMEEMTLIKQVECLSIQVEIQEIMWEVYKMIVFLAIIIMVIPDMMDNTHTHQVQISL